MRTTAVKPSWIRRSVMRTEAAAVNRPWLRTLGKALKYSPIFTSVASPVSYHFFVEGIKTFSDLGLFLAVGGGIPALLSIIISSYIKVVKAEETGKMANKLTLETLNPLINAQKEVNDLKESMDMADLQMAKKMVETAEMRVEIEKMRIDLARMRGERVKAEATRMAPRNFLIRQIGSGGSAFVWKVYENSEEENKRRMTVWKVPKPETLQNPSLMRRFDREAEVMYSLGGENIIRLYKYCSEDGQRLPMELYKYISGGHTLEDFKETGVPFMEMEYLDHEWPPLESIINLRGKLSVEEALHIAIQIAKPLDAIHKHGLVHRDIKPGNIYVGKDGKIKISDFGIVYIEQEALTKLTRVGIEMLGTPELMAPEQWEYTLGKISQATDQYALGVTLYLMIAGVFPYGNCESGEMGKTAYYTRVVSQEIMPEKSPHIPDNLWNILLRMLAVNPKDRFPSMEHCITAFQSAFPRRLAAGPAVKHFPGTNIQI